MAEFDNLPELYTQRELDKTRRRQRLMGRIEGAGAIIVAGTVLNFLGWIPTLLVLGLAGYVLYRVLSKPEGEAD